MPSQLDLGTLLASYAAAFLQQNRLLRLRFAPGSGLPEDLFLPQRIEAKEALSECYQLKIDCLSSDTHIQLKDLLGQAVDVAILLAEGGERVISGVVTQSQYLGGDGGFTRFQFQVEPALSPLAHRLNSRVFQDKTVPEIVALILDEHIQSNPVFAQTFRQRAQLDKTYPQRSYCVQYRESDLSFIQRLLREEGISYTWDFTHTDDEIGLHTMRLFDDAYSLDANLQDRIRFHRADATETDDTLTAWRAQRSLASSAVHLASYDYKPASGLSGQDASYLDQGEAGASLGSSLEDFDAQTLYYGQHPDDMARLATLRQQAKDMRGKLFEGAGSTRSLAPGTWFQLADHPIHDQDQPEQRQFIVLAQQWQAENNLPTELKTINPSPLTPSNSPFNTTFEAIRRSIPIVPDYSEDHARPRAYGIQTATVVGPAEEEIFTDSLGRIKVQLHWQRPQDHRPDQTGSSAQFDDKSSCWIRVAYPSAGANWGTQFIPRIGQEVVIDFIEGDIDRPICTGVLHNGRNPPSSFSNAGSLPNNKTLSGIKTHEYKGSGYNELTLDDTTNELRAKLSSEYAKTQLNQGYLIHPRTEGKGEPRGEGFELRTDAAGAIRAPQGLLLSADARRAAQGKQLDRQELLSQLEAAYKQTITQADHAAHQNANQTETEKQEQLKHAIENLERGTNTDKDTKNTPSPSQGAPSSSPSPSQGEGWGEGQTPTGVLMLSAPDGIALTTPNSMSLMTGANLDQVAQRDTNQTSGRRWIHNAGESISLFVAGSKGKLKETLKLIASKGKVQIQAQSDEIEISGDQSLTVTSVNDQIIVNAKEHITFAVAGGSYFKIQGGNIEFGCPGNLSVKAGEYSLTGPTSLSKEMNAWPQTNFDEEFVLRWPYDNTPVVNRRFKIMRADGRVLHGTTDAQGRTGLQKSLFLEDVQLQILSEG